MMMQTRLTISPSGQLIYNKTCQEPLPNYPLLEPSSRWPKLCHNDGAILNAPALNSKVALLQLPNETLQQILRAVVDKPLKFALGNEAYWDIYWDMIEDDDAPKRFGRGNGWARYRAAYNLIWTCKRFHALVLPLLYEDVTLDVTIHWLTCPPQAELFLNEISRRPLLKTYIKHLAIGGQSLCSDIVQTACVLPYINKLSLDKLNEEDEVDFSLYRPTRDQARTANFTEVQFHDLHARPESIKAFLERPKQLYEFILNDMITDGGSDWGYHDPSPPYRWNHTLLIDVLSPQKDHLRSLDLGWLGYDRDQNTFQASAFPNLQSLALCVAYEFPDERACQNWLTSSLKTIILDLHRNDSQGGSSSYGCMGKPRVQSITEFARMAREWSKNGGSAVGLREIGIRAYARGDSAWRDEDEVGCWHRCYEGEMKANLVQCLKNINKQGFEAFWVSFSGQKYTVQMMEAMCKCMDKRQRRV